MRYNPDQQKYSEVKSDKKKEEGSENDQPNTGGNIGTDGTRIDPGFFNYKQMMDSFFNFQPDKDDDEGRALKYSYMGNILNKAFESQLAMGLGDFQAGISKDLMSHASNISQMEQSNARKEEFSYGMRSMDKQYELQNQFQNQQFNRNMGMLDATGVQTRLNKITDGEQDRLTMREADNIAAGKANRQQARSTSQARSF